MRDLEGKVAIVTGAASGIGRGIAHAIAKAGGRVVLVDLNRTGAEEAAHNITAAGGTALAMRFDVGTPDAFEQLRDGVAAEYGDVDIVINNAGVIISGHPEDIPVAEWTRVLDVNLMSVVRSTGVFLPVMLARGSGHFVNTASFAGIMTYSFDRLPYAASKAAIFQLSEGLALYCKPKGIGVTVLCPGPVLTNIMASTRVWTDDVVVRGPGAEFAPVTPDVVGAQVVEAIREDRFFLSTHPQVRERLVARAQDFDAVLAERIADPHILPIKSPPRTNAS